MPDSRTGSAKRRLRQLAKLVRLVGCGGYRRALSHGVAAAVEHQPILSALGCSTVIDIGANKGQFSLVAAEAFSGARIFAFEPIRGPAETFRAVHGRDPRIVLHQAAIGPEKKVSTINVSRRDDSSSLLPITALQESLFPGTGLQRTEEIEVGPLDSFLDPQDVAPPALLKLDVQGYELQALRGCETLLLHFSNIYVECSFVELYAGQAYSGEIVVYLHERGFRLQGVYNMTYDQHGQAVQADFLFGR